MPSNRPHIGVQILTCRWPRFIIARSDQRYWNGEVWIADRRKALVYAHLHAVRADLKKLKQQTRRGNDK
jgi:hypothetical protein